ncbi:DHH family phosphoesterase [Ruminococcaceae bacterium OttesenSCG-928-N02]|nr:DHH family phosphoesterase [Ruminococcaceae bacterium OttesenSCG-928-N02]
MKKRLDTFNTVVLLLALACLVLAGGAVYTNSTQFSWVLLALFVLVAAVAAYGLNYVRKIAVGTLTGLDVHASAGQTALLKLQTPIVTLAKNELVWYNEAFLLQMLGGADAMLEPVQRILPGFEPLASVVPGGTAYTLGEKRYTCYGVQLQGDSDGYMIYFIDETALYETAREYEQSRPCVLHIAVDTYDEILKDLKESERGRIVAEIEAALENEMGLTTGFLRRVGNNRYIAVLEARHMKALLEGRFAMLDKVRALGGENAFATLSIGAGQGVATLAEADAMAASALEMAFGRGGDQAVVRGPDGYEFYGGASRSVEKRSKVKSRIIASALADLVSQSSNVLVMGHRMGDLDSLGAAVGVVHFCEIYGARAAIVADKHHTLAELLFQRMEKEAPEIEVISGENALMRMNMNTLLVVVDTHTPAMLEAPAVYEGAQNVVVIDHHRRMVGYIDNAALFYNEPYASSTCELVAEMLQYAASKKQKTPALVADALLSGIMLDTRNFSTRTGVRTFEAAAYLRRLGADTASVTTLFSSPMETYRQKAELIAKAEVYRGCALVIADEPTAGGSDYTVVVPMAANELLQVNGVVASFVAMPIEGQVMISARSLGAFNVQIVMEALGGGGHYTMAGAQLKDAQLADVRNFLVQAIDDYYERKPKAAKKGEE